MLSRKRFIVAAIVIVALVVLYSAAWVGVGFLTLRATERWVEDQRQHGTKITYDEPFFIGYPWRPVVGFPNVSVTLPTNAGGWTWQTLVLRASVLPWAANDLVLDIAGVHTLTGPQEITGPWPTGIATLQLAAEKATLHIRLDDGAAHGGRFDAENMTATFAGQTPLWKSDRVSVDLETASMPQPTSKLVLETDNLTLSQGMPQPLSQTIRRIRLTAELQGVLKANTLPRALEAWRSAGGDLEIRDVYIDWEPLTVAGNGTLALDEKLQPMGAFTLKFTGFFAGVDALTKQGVIKAADASLAKIVLGMMAKAPAGGGAPELALPLTIQDQKLLAGPVTLMAMPEVTWPANVVLP